MSKNAKREKPVGRGTELPVFSSGFIREVELKREEVPSFEEYPFSIPAIGTMRSLVVHPKVTFFVGENGSGKSTLIEAIAIAAGFNAEGGSKNFRFSTRRSESNLHEYLKVVRGVRREKDGFFLRAESFYNVGTEVDALERDTPGILSYYGGRSPHEQSHGESFLALAKNRFFGDGLYILDEPEAALSPSRQLAFLKLMHHLVEQKSSQFIIATHSPIIMAYPVAAIYLLTEKGIRAISYEETEHFLITRDFLARREEYLRRLFADEK